MSTSTISSKVGHELYLGYFLRHATFYPYLLQLLFRKAHTLGSLVVGMQKRELAEARRFDTPQRQRVLQTVRHIKTVEVSATRLMHLPSIELKASNESTPEQVVIPLASMDVDLNPGMFDNSYADPEDLFAANRFIWLYDLLQDNCCLQVLARARKSMQFWASNYSRPCDHPRFESYSISERLTAWLFFLMFTRGHLELQQQDADCLARSFQSQLQWLVRRLEYAGDATNNHILNNARALYICGQLLGLEDVSHLGRQIFVGEHGNVIRDGVYQEGSTHYHFLLTKNILEMAWVAELTGDTAFRAELQPLLAAMLQTCWRLQPPAMREIPLIGDISPDLRPAWFVGYPFCPDAGQLSMWFRIFNYPVDSEVGLVVTRTRATTGSQTQWARLAAGDFFVVVNLRQHAIPGHGHNDNGSVCVFFEGRPVVVDLGLSSYLGTDSDMLQISAEAHNAPAIDGYEPDISKFSALSKSRLSSSYKIAHVSATRLEFTLTYANDRVKLLRRIDISPDGCVVTDRVISSQSLPCSYAAWWHLPFEVMCASGARFIRGDLQLAFQTAAPFRVKASREFRRSASYGRSATVTSLGFKAEVECDVPLVFTITRKYHEMPL